jgi:hydroxymethylpyrimidine/phosphomethylpyrimidine kinase
VTGIHDVPPEFVTAQIDAVFSDLAVGAVKIGMLSNAATIAAVASALDRYRQTNVVLDPVMVATSGDRLLKPDAVEQLRRLLIPKCLVLTPNLPEAAALLDTEIAEDESVMRHQAHRLLKLGAKAVLIKGGHDSGPESTDLLVVPDTTTRLSAERIATRNTHGTGCTLSAAIAAGLANGQSLTEAVRGAKSYVTAAIAAADRLSIGSGHGPVHHFHRQW